jgi:hypothetical protein
MGANGEAAVNTAPPAPVHVDSTPPAAPVEKPADNNE